MAFRNVVMESRAIAERNDDMVDVGRIFNSNLLKIQ